MPNDVQPTTPASLAQRKEKLIAQGAAFRAQVIHSKDGVQASLRPESLAKQAIDHVMTTAMAALRNGSAARMAGIDLPTLLPLVTAAWSALSKRSLPKPVIRAAVILAAAGAVGMLVLKMKKA